MIIHLHQIPFGLSIVPWLAFTIAWAGVSFVFSTSPSQPWAHGKLAVDIHDRVAYTPPVTARPSVFLQIRPILIVRLHHDLNRCEFAFQRVVDRRRLHRTIVTPTGYCRARLQPSGILKVGHHRRLVRQNSKPDELVIRNSSVTRITVEINTITPPSTATIGPRVDWA
jgi:hypothetical protein